MKKVLVAMSGGVDSSVACVMLKEKGFDVTGMTLKFFNSNGEIKCCGADYSANRAREVCDILGIKHYLKDARKDFGKYVIEDFVQSYLNGLTPNPCIECNRFLKFDYLFKLAQAMNIDYLATGHYARIIENGKNFELLRGRDPNKDQSYFLYCIKKENLNKILFPLGDLNKNEVRKIAKKYNLPVFDEKESKDICFVPQGDYVSWLKKEKYVENKSGYIKDLNGKILGQHKGYFNFTIGQRRNLGIPYSQRLYVVDINSKNNEVIVSEKKDAFFSGFQLKDLNWLLEEKIKKGKKYYVQIRYRHIPQEGEVVEIKGNNLVFLFKEKQFAITKGQSAVFYDGDRVLGGGIINEIIRS